MSDKPTIEEAELRQKLANVEAERDRLKAIVDTLPKTADGVPVTPGMDVWCFDAELYLRRWLAREDNKARNP